MNFLRTDFQKAHFFIMLFAAANILLAAALRFYWLPYQTASLLHVASGVLAVLSAFLVPALFKKRKQVYAALKARLLISKRDLARKKPAVLLAKALATLLGLSFIVLALSWVLIATGLDHALLGVYLLRFHMDFLYFVIALGLLHPLTMLLAGKR